MFFLRVKVAGRHQGAIGGLFQALFDPINDGVIKNTDTKGHQDANSHSSPAP